MGLAQIKAIWTEEQGANAIEYALIALLIAMGVVGSYILLGAALQSSLQDLCARVTTVVGAGSC